MKTTKDFDCVKMMRDIRDKVNTEIILSIIRAAINELKYKEEVKILVNPAITQCIYDLSEELKQTIKGLNHIKIIEDKTIPPDGFMIESPDSRIDARLETQLAEITKNIMTEAEKNTDLIS